MVNCSGIESLPDFQNTQLHEINIAGCCCIYELPNLPIEPLLTLDISGTSISSIDILQSNILNLICIGCKLLSHITSIPKSLEMLQCRLCPELIYISELPSTLIYIELSGCTKLEFIPISCVNKVRRCKLEGSSELIYIPIEQEQEPEIDNIVTINRKRKCNQIVQTINDELIDIAWSPDRVIHWCMNEEEKYELHKQWVINKKIKMLKIISN